MKNFEQSASKSFLDFESLLFKEKGKCYFSMFLTESKQSLENLLTVYLTINHYQMKNLTNQETEHNFDQIYRLINNEFESSLNHLSNELKEKFSEVLRKKVYDEIIFNALKLELRHMLEGKYFPLFLQSNLYKENFEDNKDPDNKLMQSKNMKFSGKNLKHNRTKSPINEIKIVVTAESLQNK